ncbi:MAG: DEAD/DEAH box helicase [Candidatus Methanomethylophilaceae archaeon]|nr:DEAD/DEAH box helicase [Candidatus Methanomethylophilaceae archaeon]MBQ9689880.1 DEAD/DEAH box helicase [Candidatus Methanomethylophilaceae archaeon]
MRVDELDVSDSVAEALMEAGYVNLHPPQAEAIPIALQGHNLVVAIPTASGKSLIGYVPALDMMVRKGKKVLYIVPLKALASEKKDDFEKFSKLGIKAHLSTGDLDSDDKNLQDADIIVATSEKADSMIRHGSTWMEQVGLVIADEVHMIHDPGRGPTLEVILTKLMRRNRDLQIIALSATMSNAFDLAEWLHAKLVESDWRPIPLKEGVYYDGRIQFDDRTSRDVEPDGEEIWGLVKQAILDGGQSLIFVNSRRSTEALAVKYSKKMSELAGRTLSQADEVLLEGDAESTATGRKLSSCVKCGIAFHNAGLTYRQRKYVEDNFRNGQIKCIVATPTLAAGINLPARRVIVRDTTRYETNYGNSPISVMEIKQMCGRAGRPGYDPYGEAVLVAKSETDKEHLMEDYVEHDTERLTSKLFNEKILRSHVLGLLATGDADSRDSIIDFLKETFFGTVSQLFGIESVVDGIVRSLVEEDMAKENGEDIRITSFGKRVSDLYIDPASASILREAVTKIDDDTENLPILLAAAMTPDVLGMYPKKADTDRLNAAGDEVWDHMLVDPEDIEDYDEEYFNSDLKVALLINDWIEETDEDTLTDTMGIGPGDIRSKIDMMDWIIYAMSEIAYMFNPSAIKKIRPLMTRVRYGVKEELIDLVAFRGVGRNRARILFNHGIRSRSDIAAIDESELANIPKIGSVLASKMKDQAGGRMEVVENITPSEEEAMFEEMAADYGEAPAPVAEEKPKKQSKKKKEEEDGHKQTNLFDF